MAMRLTKNLGMLLLAIWLILGGLLPLLKLSFSGVGTLMAILAIAAANRDVRTHRNVLLRQTPNKGEMR